VPKPTSTEKVPEKVPEKTTRPEPTEAEKAKAEKKRLSLMARIEQERRDQAQEIFKMHSNVESSLATAIKSLEEASLTSERLQQHLGRNRFAREVDMERRLRLNEVVRTVNAARQHVSRVQRGSVVVGKAIREIVDELVRPEPGAAFE